MTTTTTVTAYATILLLCIPLLVHILRILLIIRLILLHYYLYHFLLDKEPGAAFRAEGPYLHDNMPKRKGGLDVDWICPPSSDCYIPPMKGVIGIGLNTFNGYGKRPRKNKKKSKKLSGGRYQCQPPLLPSEYLHLRILIKVAAVAGVVSSSNQW
jgi:hypothetical protein